jgi:CHAT domain-containing protein/tetratricopeptide (TPR) repeat protein
MVVEEMGADVKIAIGDGAFQHISYPMTRYAWRWIEPLLPDAQIQIQAGSTALTRARIHYRCQAPDTVRRAWLLEAQLLADGIDSHVQSDPSLEDFNRLVATAPEPADRVAAMHMRALVWFLRDDYLSSAEAYAQVGPMWLALGDKARAGGAYLGAADVFDRAGRNSESEPMLAKAEQVLDPDDDAYFLARIKAIRCGNLQDEGKPEELFACNTDLINRYRKLGEYNDAIKISGQLLVGVRDAGNQRRIDDLLAQMDADPMLERASWGSRGYLTLMRSFVQRDRGDLLSALAMIADSLHAFERATEGRERWQASALLQAADIYGQLGMSDQAYRLLAQAISLYDATSAPDRIAAALMKLAILDRSNGRIEAAASWYQRAEQIYALLQRPMERADAELGLLETRLPKDAREAEAQLRQPRDWSALSAANAGRLALLRVRWMIGAGDYNEARALLVSTDDQTRALPQQLLAVRLRAELDVRQGLVSQALQLLESELEHLEQLAAQGSNGILGYLAMRAGREVRADWVDYALSQSPQVPIEDWWRVLVSSAPLQSVRPGQHSGDNRFSSALSMELLGTGSSEASDRALLATLAKTNTATRPERSSLPTLAGVRARLDADWLLIIIPSEPRSAAIWISAERSVVVPVPGRSQLRDQISQLAADLETPNKPVTNVNRSAGALSASLFAGAPEASAPGRLLVLSDELIGTVPLALLRWPGSERPLIETTTIGWVARFDRSAEADTEAAAIHAIIAPGNASTEKVGLGKLRYAEQEADLIAETEPQREVIRASDARATRATLLAALSDPDAWVHLAAHGYAKPELLGYAGTWLANSEDSAKSDFLSWMDIIDTPLRAQLAVLNACQLAAGPGATSQSSLSFASAVTAAGVDHVVAAFWPISDSASAIWIPAFYTAMREQPASYSIEALQAAQLALKNSRAYRHPYYWASLAHFQRLTVDD